MHIEARQSLLLGFNQVKSLQEQLGLWYTPAQVPLCHLALISAIEAHSSLPLTLLVRDKRKKVRNI